MYLSDGLVHTKCLYHFLRSACGIIHRGLRVLMVSRTCFHLSVFQHHMYVFHTKCTFSVLVVISKNIGVFWIVSMSPYHPSNSNHEILLTAKTENCSKTNTQNNNYLQPSYHIIYLQRTHPRIDHPPTTPMIYLSPPIKAMSWLIHRRRIHWNS